MKLHLDTASYKRLEGFQPCQALDLEAGTHLFAVYGDNFLMPTTYTIEALCAKTYEDTIEKHKDIEAQILRKKSDICRFEMEYRKAWARCWKVSQRYTKVEESCNELLKLRESILSSFIVAMPVSVTSPSVSGHFGNGSSSEFSQDYKSESAGEEKVVQIQMRNGFDFGIELKGSDKKYN